MYLAVLLTALLMGHSPEDGSVIFIKYNGKEGKVAREIEKATGDNLVHAAIVLYINNIPYVYESRMSGGVQRNTLSVFLDRTLKRQTDHPQMGLTWQIVPPDRPYSIQELQRMKAYADSQLGRRYMVRGYWKEREVRGVHCSQYVGNIVAQSGRIISDDYKESPKSLYDKMMKTH